MIEPSTRSSLRLKILSEDRLRGSEASVDMTSGELVSEELLRPRDAFSSLEPADEKVTVSNIRYFDREGLTEMFVIWPEEISAIEPYLPSAKDLQTKVIVHDYALEPVDQPKWSPRSWVMHGW